MLLIGNGNTLRPPTGNLFEFARFPDDGIVIKLCRSAFVEKSTPFLPACARRLFDSLGIDRPDGRVLHFSHSPASIGVKLRRRSGRVNHADLGLAAGLRFAGRRRQRRGATPWQGLLRLGAHERRPHQLISVTTRKPVSLNRVLGEPQLRFAERKLDGLTQLPALFFQESPRTTR